MTVRKFFSLAFFLLLATFGFAQGVASGDLHVTVRDPKGSVVTNATVTARDQAKAFERSTAVNTEGEYRILALPPGTYTVTVESQGFAKTEISNVAVTVGQMAELPIALSIGGTREVVTVSSEAELVETQRSSSTDTIEQRRIDNLPINGRNYINFALTDSRLARDDAPSIGAAPTSGLNMSGQRARANLVNVDGADAVDNSVNGIRSTVSQEAVQEFQIQTNGYAAEYGRASGGVVNIITRSGSNDMHGTLFGYLRNRNFQAVNPFSTVSNPAYTRVQAGAAFGGALKKDKTFYYFSYEGTWRQETGFSSIGANNFGLSPFDASAFLGLPPQSFVVQATPEQTQFLSTISLLTPGAAQYVVLLGRSSGMALDGVWPGPPALGGGFNGFTTSCAVPPCFVPRSFVPLNSLIGNFPVTERTDLYSLRLDHNITNSNRLMLRGGVSPSDITGIQVQAQGPQNFGQNAFSRTSNQNYHDWSITGQDQWTIGNNKINEFRFQYARRGLLYGFSRGPGGSNVGVNIPGFAFFGREPFSFVKRTEQRYQTTDNFSISKATHSIKFGVDGNYVPVTADFTVNFGGIYNFGQQALFPTPFPAFSPVQAYGAGIPSNFIQGVGNPHDGFSNTTAGAFIQDSWRIKSNFTLNYGVRYYVEFTPTFSPINSVAAFGQKFLGISQGIPRDFNNVAPRIGFAWDPWKDGKGVFRASYGIFYDHPLLALAFDSDVADGAQAPQFVLFGGTPCVVGAATTPNPLNLNAANTFQGIAGNTNCTPPGLTQALNFLPDQQRFNPTPNAPSAFVNQGYLQPPGVPLIVQPFGFPTAKNFQYASSQQANFTFERDLGHDFSLSLEYNFNGGRHLNRPINSNAVKNQFLIQNYNIAVAAGAVPSSPPNPIGPLTIFTDQNTGVPCGVNPNPGPLQGQPWVAAALVSFFRPSGLNPSIANFVTALGAGGCVTLANSILQAEGLNGSCDSATLTNCVPFSDMPANFSNGSAIYHGFTANLRKRFGQKYEFLTSYTWSHSIDDSTDLESPLSPQDNYDPSADRSNSLFDQRHRFVFSGVYQSGSLGGSGFAGKFFSNWTVAPIIEAVSGRPFNIIVGDDRNFDFGTTTDRPLVVPAGTQKNFCGDAATASRFSPTGFLQPACFLNGTVVGNLGRNAGTKPHDIFTDIRIAKRIPLGERVALEGIVDAFNMINRFNVADVNPLWNSGQKATAAFYPRQFQFALKLNW
jgi:hypothetical protein